MSVITFLTDFGLQDDFVGTCHGVIARIAPDARVIDITHGIAPQAVLQGALVLAQHDRLHAGRRAPRGRRPGRRRRAPRDRGAHGRRPRVRRPRQRPARCSRPSSSGSTAAHELADERYRLPERVAHLSRTRRLRAGGRASRGRRADRASSGRRRAVAARARRRARARGRQDADLGDRARPSTASATSRRTRAAEHLDGLGVADGDRVEIRLDARPLLRGRRRHVRRRTARRADPLRGLVRTRHARDQRRRRGRG